MNCTARLPILMAVITTIVLIHLGCSSRNASNKTADQGPPPAPKNKDVLSIDIPSPQSAALVLRYEEQLIPNETTLHEGAPPGLFECVPKLAALTVRGHVKRIHTPLLTSAPATGARWMAEIHLYRPEQLPGRAPFERIELWYDIHSIPFQMAENCFLEFQFDGEGKLVSIQPGLTASDYYNGFSPNSVYLPPVRPSEINNPLQIQY